MASKRLRSKSPRKPRIAIEPLEERVIPADWSGPIPDGTIWDDTEVQRIVGDASVPFGSTLTIEPGAIVKFDVNAGISLTIDGSLNATGTAGQAITFTSVRDDSIGGDTNGDGSATDPTAGDWESIEFTAGSSGNVLDHVNVRYGGSNSFFPGSIRVQGPLSMTNSSVRDSYTDGVRIDGASPTITGTTFEANLKAALAMDLASAPSLSGNTITNNGLNALSLDGGTLAADAQWNQTQVVYHIPSEVIVPAGKTLTISPGMVVKSESPSNYGRLVVNGTLQADGTPELPIIFTSVHDDTVGGDTDNSTVAPGVYDWFGMRLENATSILDHVEVRYARDGSSIGSAAVTVDGGSLTFMNGLIRDHGENGIRIQNATPTINVAAVTIRDGFNYSGASAISMDLASNPTLSDLTFVNNPVNGVLIEQGTLPGDGVWDDAGIPYVIPHFGVTVPAGRTLTVGPGQVVKSIGLGIVVDGTLEAHGTELDPIVFTSVTDDSIGGDTDNAVNSYNWGSLIIGPTGSANISQTELRNGGNSYDMLRLDGGELTLTDSTFVDSSYTGLGIFGANPVLDNVSFVDTDYAAIRMDIASDPTIHGATFTNNGVNGMQLEGGTITSNIAWDDPEVVYYLAYATTVGAGTTLTIAPGQIIKPASTFIVDGKIIADGTPENPIIITAFGDDSLGGDTNNNGAPASRPFWNALELSASSAGNVFDNVEFHFASEGGNGFALGAVDTDFTMTNCVIRDSAANGIRLYGSTATIRDTEFIDIPYHAINMDMAAKPTLHSLSYTNVGTNGVFLDGGTITSDMVWDNPEVMYHFGAADGIGVTIPDGVTLTIAPGQVVKSFAPLGASYFVVEGTLIARGRADAPIIFTRGWDDSAGGNSGSYHVQPGMGFGNNIWFQGSRSGSILEYVDHRYAVGDAFIEFYGGIIVDDSELTIRNSIIRDGWGVESTNNSSVELVNNVFSRNGPAIFAEKGGTVTAINNTIDSDVYNTFAVVATTGGTVNLTNNIISGPTGDHESGGIAQREAGTVNMAFNNVHTWLNYEGFGDQTGLNGNISADPRYFSAKNMNYQLRPSSPAIDAGTSVGAPALDHFGKSRFDDRAIANSGGGGQRFFDMGAIERQEIVTSDVDLAAFAVSGPITGLPDELVTVTWSVRNLGQGTAVATWSDAVYLSSVPVYTPSATFLGRLEHDSDLGPGQSYTASLEVPLRGLRPGRNYFVVRTNDRTDVFEGTAQGNNAAASAAALEVVVPTLTIGTPLADQFTAAGQARFYQLTVPAGQTLELTLDSASASSATELYLRRDLLPTRSEFDFGGVLVQPDQELLVAATEPGTYFVEAFASFGDAASIPFTLTARLRNFGIQSISPTSAGNAGRVTLAVRGNRLTSAAAIKLVAPDNSELPAVATQYVDPTLTYATFELTGQAIGFYSIAVAQDGNQDVLPDAFQVIPGFPGQFEARIVAPARIRAGTVGDMTVYYRNVGGADVVAPLMILEAKKATVRFAGPNGFTETGLEFLAINNSGPAGILPPGASGSVQFRFWGTTNERIDLSLHQVIADMPLDWNAAKENLRPAAVDPDAWDVIYANFVASVGNTTSSYETALARNATYLSQLGDHTSDVERLLALELAAAGDFGAISQRYTLGALGRGIPDTTELSATVSPTPGVVLIRAGGLIRTFNTPITSSALSYRGVPGDRGELEFIDGAFRLREADGTIFQFRPQGPIDYILDTNGNRITAEYQNGRLTALVDSFGDRLSYSYNAQGRISQITDPVGRVTTYAYDTSGEHLLTVTDPAGTTQFTYVTGQGAAREHAIASVTGRDGVRQSFEYDARGRLTRTYIGNESEEAHFDYAHPAGVTITDELGTTRTVLRNENGQPELVRDTTGNATRFAYDLEGKLARVEGPDRSSVGLAYDFLGNPSQATDALGQRFDVSFDATFRRLQSLRDARGNSINFSYDGGANLHSITHPDGSSEQFSYDAAGHVTETVDRDRDKVRFTYNDDNLLIRQDFADGSQTNFTYDAHRNLLTATDARGTIALGYDAADRLTSIAYPGGRSLTFTYDAASRRKTSTDQGGFTVRYEYDALGRLSELKDTATARIVAYSYDIAGRLAREDKGNGTFTTYDYTANGHVESIVHHDPQGVVHSRFDYTYDTLGRVISMTTLEGITTYGYDATGQLTTVNLPSGRSIAYQYDAAGNRVAVIDNGATTDYSTNNLNQYLTAGSASFNYDLDGNLLSRSDFGATTRYGYDDLGRIVSIATPTESLSYEYDALGNRIATVRNGERTEYLIDPLGIGDIVAEYNSGGLAAHYVHGNGLVGRFAPSGSPGFYNFDGLGNTAELTGPSGDVVNSYSYLPFGELVDATGAGVNSFTFGGQWGVTHETAGNFLMRLRLYDATTGRFVSPDPIGLTGGDNNLYRYVNNQPTMFVDPTGLAGTAPIAAAGLRMRCPLPAAGPAAAAAEELGPLLSATFAGAFLGTGIAASYLISADVYGGQSRVNEAASDLINASFAGLGITAAAGGLINYFAVGAAEFVTGLIGFGVGFLGGTLAFTGGYLAGTELRGQNILYLDTLFGYTADKLVRGYDFFFPRDTQLGPRAREALRNSIIRKCHELGLSIEECHRLLAEAGVDIVFVHDPNDIGGPAGFGPDRFVTPAETFPYKILFENKPEATAAVVKLEITHQLDTDLDWSTFEVGNFGFGDLHFEVPHGRRFYQARVDYTATRGEFVDVTVEVDLNNGVAKWTFQSIDPATGQPTNDVDAGFLPPNINAPEGVGFVNYTIRPKATLTSGTKVNAQASIVFDNNDALPTPVFTNTIDAVAPVTTPVALPADVRSSFIRLQWAGQDEPGGSGIVGYDVSVSDDGGPFATIAENTLVNSLLFRGRPGHAYQFRVAATDGVGHVEIPKTLSTQIVADTAKKHIFTDDDGDVYTISLSGPGQVVFDPNDPDLNGKGPIGHLTLVGTNPAKSRLSVTTKKAKTGDGRVSIAVIDGSALKALTARNSDLQVGIDLDGPVGALTLRDIKAGASVQADGVRTGRTTMTLQVVETDVTFNLGTAISSFQATSVGAGSNITSPSIGTLRVRGNFDADLTLAGTGDPKKPTTLASATIAGNVTNSTWNITGNLGSIRVGGTVNNWNLDVDGRVNSIRGKQWDAGNVTADSLNSVNIAGVVNGSTFAVAGSVNTFSVWRFVDSQLLAGFVPTNPADPFAGGTLAPGAWIKFFRVTGVKNSNDPTFANSVLAATAYGMVRLKSIAADNGGDMYGLISADGITQLTVTTPSLTLRKVTTTPDLPDEFGDFEVRML